MPRFDIDKGSPAHQFLLSRRKVQIIAGGFGAGKTAQLCVKAYMIAKDYPGCRILAARSTYPKLTLSLQPELFKWVPSDKVKSFNKTDRVLTLTNGSVIEFNYVMQQGRGKEQQQSNLLSASYDAIIIDQLEDPEFTYKDFLDLLGRMRGTTPFRGSDASMPSTGPRWFMATANPSHNWLYREVVKPTLDHEQGVPREDVMWDKENQCPLIHVIHTTTYDNQRNLSSDYIQTMEATYSGQMRERYLMGKWGAFEGLVHPDFSNDHHVLPHESICEIMDTYEREGLTLKCIEGHDHGIAVPSCHLMAFVDAFGNIFVFDGIYQSGGHIERIANAIKHKRRTYDDLSYGMPFADPAMMKRNQHSASGTVLTVADLFREQGSGLQRANKDIMAGVEKINGYLVPKYGRPDPLRRPYAESPALFFSSKLTWLIDEIADYRWQQDSDGSYKDKPIDRNDHAMNALRYLLTPRPEFSAMRNQQQRDVERKASIYSWTEHEEQQDTRRHRYV